MLCKHNLFNIWLNSDFLITGRSLTHCTPMLLWQPKMYYSSSYECSHFPKCNPSFQVLIHRTVNKVWLKFLHSHQAQFPVLDLKKLLGHCQNKVHWSFSQSQAYCELSKTPDILHQLSEPCSFLAQRLGEQKIETPSRGSFQQLLILAVRAVPAWSALGEEQLPAGTQHPALHTFYTREHLGVPESHTETPACRE